MESPGSADTGQNDSANVFGLIVTHSYWHQRDFWLACIAAALFWVVFRLLNAAPPVGTQQHIIAAYFCIPCSGRNCLSGLNSGIDSSITQPQPPPHNSFLAYQQCKSFGKPSF